MDFYGFYTGTEFHAHEYLGAHVTDDGVVFRVFAPAASGIAVIGEFNEWSTGSMTRVAVVWIAVIHMADGWNCGLILHPLSAGVENRNLPMKNG